MAYSERELRQAAERIVQLLPDDHAAAKRVLELAMVLKRWEDGMPLSEAEQRKISIVSGG